MADCSLSNQFPNDGNSGNNRNLSNDDKRKLFVGGLSYETEIKDLYTYFSKFGEVEKVDLRYNLATGRHRGFAFVTFVDEKSAESVLISSPHIIRRRAVDPRRPKIKSGIKKIFVGGIDGDLSNVEIQNYFEQFGTVENIERPFDRQRNRSREFCFIIFSTNDAVESAISLPKQIIGGRECDIKLAHPNRNNSHQNGHNGMNMGMNRGGRGAPQNAFFKNRNQNINFNWRNAEHPNGNYLGSNNDKQYNNARFLNNFENKFKFTYRYPLNF